MEIETKKIVVDIAIYLWALFMAILSGVVNHFSGIRRDKKSFVWVNFLIDILGAGVTGTITYHLCMDYGLSGHYTIALTAISGHMGARALVLFENHLRSKAGLDK